MCCFAWHRQHITKLPLTWSKISQTMILTKSITIIRKAEEQVSDQCKRAASTKHPSWFVGYNGFSPSGGGKEKGHRKDRWGTAELPSSHFPALSRSLSLNSWSCLSQGLIRLCPKDTEDSRNHKLHSAAAAHTHTPIPKSACFCVTVRAVLNNQAFLSYLTLRGHIQSY